MVEITKSTNEFKPSKFTEVKPIKSDGKGIEILESINKQKPSIYKEI